MKRTYLSALAALSFATSVFACGDYDYTGSICTTSNTYCPAGTHLADGTVLLIQQYPALYSVIGPYYGGDAQKTFALPDLSGRTPVGYGQSTGTSYVQFTKPRGQESVTLSYANLPVHTHPFSATTGSQNVIIPATAGVNTTLSGTVGVVPAQGDTGNNFTPVAGKTYQLAGASVVGGQNMIGPYSVTALPATPAKVSGVSVDASGMTPAIPAQTVAIQTVTGGTVGANNSVQSSTMATIPPQLGMLYCITMNGTYPPRP